MVVFFLVKSFKEIVSYRFTFETRILIIVFRLSNLIFQNSLLDAWFNIIDPQNEIFWLYRCDVSRNLLIVKYSRFYTLDTRIIKTPNNGDWNFIYQNSTLESHQSKFDRWSLIHYFRLSSCVFYWTLFLTVKWI